MVASKIYSAGAIFCSKGGKKPFSYFLDILPRFMREEACLRFWVFDNKLKTNKKRTIPLVQKPFPVISGNIQVVVSIKPDAVTADNPHAALHGEAGID